MCSRTNIIHWAPADGPKVRVLRWSGRGRGIGRDCPGTGTGRFKIIDYSKAAWTIEDLSDYLDYLISAGHLKVLSLDYSISRIALKCGEEYRLLPGMLFILPAAKHME